jgi:hypothetical protein
LGKCGYEFIGVSRGFLGRIGKENGGIRITSYNQEIIFRGIVALGS